MYWVSPIYAGQVLGIHILHPYELEHIEQLLKTEQNKDEWVYVTIPFSLADMEKKEDWQKFFDLCRKKKVIPLVRLVTKPEGDTWQVPTKKDIVDMSKVLSSLRWPTEERHIILFNEPNHAKEWGGEIDPVSFAEVLRFGAEWFKTEKVKYIVLPGAMDLAAPNGTQTMEAFNYWDKVLEHDPEVLSLMDYWNSHSYPNPGFSSPANYGGKNGLRGFEFELAYVKEKTGLEPEVFITETGWIETPKTTRFFTSYYDYAMKNIWSNPKVKGVTPFLLHGAPGPFADFSFIDDKGNKTKQFDAYRKLVEAL